MKVINRHTGKEHNIDSKTLESWQNAGIPVKVVEVEKPTAVKEKEEKKESENKGFQVKE